VFATFTGLALLGIADFGGTLRGRSGAIAGAAVTGFALACLGTWASSQPVGVDAVVTAVTGAGIVTIALLGGYLTAGASAVTLFYLIAVGSPASVSVIGQRLAGIAFGGALCVIGAVTLWPAPATTPALERPGWTAEPVGWPPAGHLRHRASGRRRARRDDARALGDRRAGGTARVAHGRRPGGALPAQRH
jgi:hypothetical protein